MVSWGFVRLFSAMELNLPDDASAALETRGVSLPPRDAFLTGTEFREEVLLPLATLLAATGKCALRMRCHVPRREPRAFSQG